MQETTAFPYIIALIYAVYSLVCYF